MKSPLGLVSGRILPLVAVLAALLVTMPARANLLTSTSETQLETWLGQGSLNFSNIFTKVAGDGQSSGAYHGAVDGQGATFTLLEISGGHPGGHDGVILGGYNPDSWSSTSGWTMRLTEADRHAFIYNLTSGVKQNQNLNGQGWSGFFSSGDYEVYNHASYGPVFGGGYDLSVTGGLENGSAYNFSYGGTSFGTNITGDSGMNTTFSITRLEVYTVSSAAVAVPDGVNSLGLLAFSAVGLFALRRRLAALTALGRT